MPAFLSVLLLLASLGRDDKSPEEESATQLAAVRRIYIDILTGGDAALTIRDLLMTSLQSSKQFIITEDEEKADATLKGSGADEVFTDSFQSSEGLNAHTQVGGGASGTTKSTSASASNRYAGMTIGETESRHTQERKHEAIATVRLVNKDGDVIWSATAESLGGKFLGASADVADKIAKHLVTDYKAAKKLVDKQPAVAVPQGSFSHDRDRVPL
jgi:hypothetical protein